MASKTTKPYMIYLAEIIYRNIADIKKNNLDISNISAIEGFIGTKLYEEISSGSFHDSWFKDLKDNKCIDKKSGEKIPEETIKLLNIQKEITIQQLIKIPVLYETKSNTLIEASNRAYQFLWRMCESYELWCKETNQSEILILKITD